MVINYCKRILQNASIYHHVRILYVYFSSWLYKNQLPCYLHVRQTCWNITTSKAGLSITSNL